ncbi:MAG: 2-phosphosulfolactate phosphatase [Chloroflexi bacterium]|nr:2-phosphosulfolactate phosphatase [Chloroflexota bacterium]
MRIEVAFLPPLAGDVRGKVCLVIDVLRASTTLVTLFDRGCPEVILAENAAAARHLAPQFNALLCGEEDGLPPPGFDYGNSPDDFRALDLRGRRVVFSTSNGTRALHHVAQAARILIGCFANANAAIARATETASQLGADLVIVCSGRLNGTSFGLDDVLCAGALLHFAGDEILPTDSARAAHLLYRAMFPSGASPQALYSVLRETEAGQYLQAIGLERDLESCVRLNASLTVPELQVGPDDLLRVVSGQELVSGS